MLAKVRGEAKMTVSKQTLRDDYCNNDDKGANVVDMGFQEVKHPPIVRNEKPTDIKPRKIAIPDQELQIAILDLLKKNGPLTQEVISDLLD